MAEAAGEPQDGDGGDVVDRAEEVSEVLVRQVRECAAVGLAARLELLLRDEHGGDEAGGDQEHAHDHRGGGQQFLRVPDTAGGLLLGVVEVAFDVRHDRDAGLEAGQAKGQLREDQQRDADHGDDVAVLGGQGAGPVGDHVRGGGDVPQAHHHDDDVQGQVDPDQNDGDADGLQEALEEHRPEQRDQQQRDQHLLVVQYIGQVRVLDQVGGGVRRRQRDGDQEVGGGEAEQRQDEQLAFPERQQPFQHRDRSLARGLSSATRR